MTDTHFIRGNRGGRVLIHEGYRYQLNKRSDDRTYWRCWREDCRATLIASNTVEDVPVILRNSEHTHGQDNQMVSQHQFRERLIEAVKEDLSCPIKKTYEKSVLNEVDRSSVLPFDMVKSTLQRVRQSFLPPIPRLIEEVVVPGPWRETFNGNPFLLHQDNDWGILVYATPQSLGIMGRNQVLYIDATFKKTPKPYKQFLTIHTAVFDRVLPMVFVLMTHKTTAAYREVISQLKQNVILWDPVEVVCDFEIAILAAVQTELPSASIKGCFFHLSKSFHKKIASLGLRRASQNRDNLKKTIRKYVALAYLPLPLMRQNLRILDQANESNGIYRQYPAMRRFHAYVENNYFDGEFPPQIWNVYARDTETRTNNFVEAFNSSWNRSFRSNKPTLWYFLTKLKERQELIDAECQAAENGIRYQRRRQHWRKFDEKIQTIKRQYVTGRRTLEEYWSAVVYSMSTLAGIN